jgi:hypothetical protein
MWSSRTRAGYDDGAQLHRGERGLPRFGLIVEHDDDPVTGANALVTQPVGDAVGARGHLGEGEPGLGAVLLHDPQCDAVVACRNGVEPVQRPIEALGPRPVELLVRRRAVGPVPQQEVPCRPELLSARARVVRHLPSSRTPITSWRAGGGAHHLVGKSRRRSNTLGPATTPRSHEKPSPIVWPERLFKCHFTWAKAAVPRPPATLRDRTSPVLRSS